jgi:SAM-dependent methyltransferase
MSRLVLFGWSSFVRRRLLMSAALTFTGAIAGAEEAAVGSEPPAASVERAVRESPSLVDPASPDRQRRDYMGRTIAPTMHFSGAGWLTRPTREQEEDPLKMLNSLGIQLGQTVCDFGCGNGYHTLQLAKRVGPTGIVYAIDIQPEMLEMLRERAGSRGLENVKPILPTEEDNGLPAATFDFVLMVDVYHELSEPDKALAGVRNSLKPSGRLVLVEFREEDEEVPILPLHKMSQRQVMKELTSNGFKLVGQFNRLPWQHVMHFARDDSPAQEVALKPWTR